jgi:hypothetical protein
MVILENLIKKVLKEEISKPMGLKKRVRISENLKYHLDNNITLSENVFRIYSQSYFDLINEVRDLYEGSVIDLNQEDMWIVESNLGKSVLLENGRKVWLDAPIELQEPLNEAMHRGKNVKLGSPFRTPGGPKKFAV